jgi:hypothetical protein
MNSPYTFDLSTSAASGIARATPPKQYAAGQPGAPAPTGQPAPQPAQNQNSQMAAARQQQFAAGQPGAPSQYRSLGRVKPAAPAGPSAAPIEMRAPQQYAAGHAGAPQQPAAGQQYAAAGQIQRAAPQQQYAAGQPGAPTPPQYGQQAAYDPSRAARPQQYAAGQHGAPPPASPYGQPQWQYNPQQASASTGAAGWDVRQYNPPQYGQY